MSKQEAMVDAVCHAVRRKSDEHPEQMLSSLWSQERNTKEVATNPGKMLAQGSQSTFHCKGYCYAMRPSLEVAPDWCCDNRVELSHGRIFYLLAVMVTPLPLALIAIKQ